MKALGTFLYKAADTRNDVLAYGGGGAALGAGLGAALGGPDDRGSRAGLGAVAGGTLGSLYGMDKDNLNSIVSGVFKDSGSGNPISTGIGAGVLGAGGLAAKDYLMRSNDVDTVGEPAGGSHEYRSSMGDVPVENKNRFVSEMKGHEDRLTKEILEGRIKTSPIHDNFLKVLRMTGATEQADTLARRLAAKHLMGNEDLLNQIKSGIQGADDAAASSFKSNKVTNEGKLLAEQKQLADSKKPSIDVRNLRDKLVKDPGNANLTKELKSFEGLDKTRIADDTADIGKRIKMLESLLAKEAPKVGMPDAGGFMKHISGMKVKPSTWGRYGVAGLGAGALGMILAGLENKVRG